MTELSNYCRLCADIKLQTDLVDTLINENLDIQEKIYSLFEIQIADDSDLPKAVCNECFNRVINCYEFKEVVKKSQDILREIISLNKNVKTEENFHENVITNQFEDNTLNDDFFNDSKFSPEFKSEKGDKESDNDDEEEDDDDDDDSFKPKKSVERRVKRSTTKETTKEKKKTRKNSPKIRREIWDNYKWKCNDCDADISSVKHLRRHYSEVHNTFPTYACSDCNKVYNVDQFSAFSKHICRHFNNSSKHRKYTVRPSLPEDYEKTEDGRPKCGECGKIFKAVKYLRNHAVLHLPEETKPKFTCTVCNKSFQTIYSLNYHNVIHSENRVLAYCEHCGKGFSNKRNLEIHKQTQHSEERPYHCNQCPKSFKSAPNLQTHLKAHRGLRPHRCDICGKLFATKGTLKRHSSTHSGVLPFECEYCHKRFRIAQFLKIHIRQHTGERPFSCEECNHHFANSSNYIKHMKGRHGIFSIAKNPVNCNIKYLIATANKQQQQQEQEQAVPATL